MKYKLSYNAPKTESELISRSDLLTGNKLIEIYKFFGMFFQKKHKSSDGYLGKIMEMYLGASAGNLPIPDFPDLGIELKILPLNRSMLPKKNIKICSTSFFPFKKNTLWEKSILRSKLKKILWIPFQSDTSIPFNKRKIYQPFIFKLKKYEKVIKQDYENIMEFIFLGKVYKYSSSLGKYLILGNVSSNKKLTSFFNLDGHLVKSNYIGFYLNKAFIKKMMYENLHI